jgi:maltooligosyltrehalose trehalohydrolase
MHTFRVWATIPQRVELAFDQKRLPMKRNEQAWWSVTVDAAGPGSDYGFVLDGQGPFPDPRSAWQPHGVHALSRLVDQDAFSWSDAGFRPDPAGLAQAVIYELHLGTFTPEGTLVAAIDKLDLLVRLGVTHVELMPIHQFPGEHGWGYDGVDLFAPHQPYGGPDGMKRFVDACHARNLTVLLDVVYNHLGPSGNYLDRFAPYFNDRYHSPWGWAVSFDGPHSDEVRRFYCDNALMWLRDYHVDGLRLDAVHAMHDMSARPFLEQLNDEARELSRRSSRRLVMIAESDLNDPRLIGPQERGGFGLDAQWSDDFHHALHAVLTGERDGYYEDFGMLADLAKALRAAYVYDGRYSMHRRRRHGRPPVGLDGRHFLAYSQTHDQVGNRARGERLSQLAGIGGLKIAAALVFTSPFVPMLFQGEEWGASTPFLYFTDHAEPDLAEAIREGRRREFAAFGWKPEEVPDPQAPDTFRRSKLIWTERERQPHAELIQWYRALIDVRRTQPALASGELELVRTRYDEPARWLTMERGAVTVVVNFADVSQRIPVAPGTHAVLLASAPLSLSPDGEALLPGAAVAILTRT